MQIESSVQLKSIGSIFIPSKPLKITSDFLYWDNKRSKIVAYGKAEAIHDKMFVVTKDSWEKVMNKFISSIVNETPFQKAQNFSGDY